MQMLIYHKSSIQDMSEIATASVDLVVTSPPYWNIVDYHDPNQLGLGLTYEHFFHLFQKNLLECMRVLKEDSFAVFIVGDIRKEAGYYGKHSRPRIYSLQADIINFFIKMGFDLFQHYVWKKTGINKKPGIVYGTVGRNEHRGLAYPSMLYSELSIEHILVFRKPGNKRATPNIKQRFSEFNAIPIEDVRKWVDPIWIINPVRNAHHPATFPKELIYRIIKMYSFELDTVLDPFMGVGTTADVALALNRKAIGYEVNLDFINMILEKYARHEQQKNSYVITT